MIYSSIKIIHLTSILLSFSLFFLRGLWMWQGTLVQRERWVRIAPHVVDTLLLTSAIAMVVMLSLPVLDTPWLLTKIAALLLYIVLGSVALRRGKVRNGGPLLDLSTSSGSIHID